MPFKRSGMERYLLDHGDAGSIAEYMCERVAIERVRHIGLECLIGDIAGDVRLVDVCKRGRGDLRRSASFEEDRSQLVAGVIAGIQAIEVISSEAVDIGRGSSLPCECRAANEGIADRLDLSGDSDRPKPDTSEECVRTDSLRAIRQDSITQVPASSETSLRHSLEVSGHPYSLQEDIAIEEEGR